MNGQRNRIGKLDKMIFDRKEDQYRFVFKNGYTLVIKRLIFFQHTLIKLEDNCVYYEFSPDPVLSGMLTYCLFETYGFPLEFAIDEMTRIGVSVDEIGYRVMEELARGRNKNTFKDSSAFGKRVSEEEKDVIL